MSIFSKPSGTLTMRIDRVYAFSVFVRGDFDFSDRVARGGT